MEAALLDFLLGTAAYTGNERRHCAIDRVGVADGARCTKDLADDLVERDKLRRQLQSQKDKAIHQAGARREHGVQWSDRGHGRTRRR